MKSFIKNTLLATIIFFSGTGLVATQIVPDYGNLWEIIANKEEAYIIMKDLLQKEKLSETELLSLAKKLQGEFDNYESLANSLLKGAWNGLGFFGAGIAGIHLLKLNNTVAKLIKREDFINEFITNPAYPTLFVILATIIKMYSYIGQLRQEITKAKIDATEDYIKETFSEKK